MAQAILSILKYYGRTTDDSVLINGAMDQINEAFPNTFCSVSPSTQLIIVTWIDYQKTDTQQVSILISMYSIHEILFTLIYLLFLGQ